MNSIDDTFQKLKKANYETIEEIYQSRWNLPANAKGSDYHTYWESVLIKNGWTFEEWQKEVRSQIQRVTKVKP